MSESALQGIHNLLADYGALLDRHQVEPWLDLFAEASCLDVDGTKLRTREDRRNLATNAPQGLHLANLPNIVGDPGSGELTSNSTFMFWNTRKGRALTGWYEDELCRHEERWQFVSRRISYLNAVAPEMPSASRE
jgi:3-phenylpropionate/cinnamic acid dioxygenase small subunit